MSRHTRFLYHLAAPLGKNRSFVTGCTAHQKLSKDIAEEGTVLLKNDGTLPLKPGTKICLFGRGAGRNVEYTFNGGGSVGFLLGGGGSGRVVTDLRHTLADALEAAHNAGQIRLFTPLTDCYTKLYQEERDTVTNMPIDQRGEWQCGHTQRMPVLPEEIYQQAKAFGGTAIFCVSRYSTENTFRGERTGGQGDFYLWPEEQQLLERLTADFEKVVVVLNVCGVVSTLEYQTAGVNAVLYPMFGGSHAGTALVDILLGKSYPSGHLQDTLARSVDDYPSTASARESNDYVNYTEDIFVGYRYFETFAPDKVVYPFGYGLSYTTFTVSTQSAVLDKNTVKLSVSVRNTGSFPGKEVVQAYLTAPQGKLGKAAKVLCAFQKTRELKPGEEATVQLHFDIREFASFDDLGKIAESAFILEAGEYTVSVGCNVRDTAPALTFRLDSDILCRRCHSYMAPSALQERLRADGTMEPLPMPTVLNHPKKPYRLKAEAVTPQIPLADALEKDRLDAFMAGLSDQDLVQMLYGHPCQNVSGTNAIGMFLKERRDPAKVPMIPTADGPAGLRTMEASGVSTTWFPCANVVSQSWNLALAKKMGKAAATECKENNVGIWLAPALNIHRTPLCGRNFEYFSEDPLTSGLFAAAVTQGVQSQNVAATIKHFCCNNKEVNRKESDSRVSQRALREVYLRAFEIAIKKGKPWALMTSYNKVNGVRSSANWEAINGVLRGEWHYDGLVMTDWWTFSTLEEELMAGSDVKMPELITEAAPNAPAPYDLAQTLTDGQLDRGSVLAAVRRILLMMGHLE